MLEIKASSALSFQLDPPIYSPGPTIVPAKKHCFTSLGLVSCLDSSIWLYAVMFFVYISEVFFNGLHTLSDIKAVGLRNLDRSSTSKTVTGNFGAGGYHCLDRCLDEALTMNFSSVSVSCLKFLLVICKCVYEERKKFYPFFMASVS